jgi:hypothetical protein
MVFAFFKKAEAMTPSKHLLRLIVCSGIVLFFWALASRAMTADSLTLRISPHGLEFHAEGSQK